jgi:hypothetical protein
MNPQLVSQMKALSVMPSNLDLADPSRSQIVLRGALEQACFHGGMHFSGTHVRDEKNVPRFKGAHVSWNTHDCVAVMLPRPPVKARQVDHIVMGAFAAGWNGDLFSRIRSDAKAFLLSD